MSDNSMIERWNVIDTAEMAVGVEGVLYRLINQKPLPFDFEKSLRGATDFLEEASSGGAIICGNSQESGFTGTLLPLNLTTDIYVKFSPGKETGSQFYQEIVDTLERYKELLEQIKRDRKVDTSSNVPREVYNFFTALANILIDQSDPITKTYSCQV